MNKFTLLIGSFILLTLNLDAQSLRDSLIEAKTEEKAFVRRDNFSKFNPNPLSPVVSSFTLIDLGVTEANNKATINFGADINNAVVSAKIVAPFKSDDKQKTPITLDGLSNSTSIKLGILFRENIDNGEFGRVSDVFDSIRTTLNLGNIALDTKDLDSLLEEIDYKKVYGSIKWTIPLLLGFNIGVGTNDFKYFTDSTSFTELKTNETNYTINFNLGTMTQKNGVWFLTAQYQDYFKAGKAGDYNIPVNAGGTTVSKSLTAGEPRRIQETLLRIEHRKIYSYNKFAINPSIEYAFGEEQFSLQLPFYFIPAKEKGKVKGLKGGLLVAWNPKRNRVRIEQNNTIFGIFIGSTFSSIIPSK